MSWFILKYGLTDQFSTFITFDALDSTLISDKDLLQLIKHEHINLNLLNNDAISDINWDSLYECIYYVDSTLDKCNSILNGLINSSSTTMI